MIHLQKEKNQQRKLINKQFLLLAKEKIMKRLVTRLS